MTQWIFNIHAGWFNMPNLHFNKMLHCQLSNYTAVTPAVVCCISPPAFACRIDHLGIEHATAHIANIVMLGRNYTKNVFLTLSDDCLESQSYRPFLRQLRKSIPTIRRIHVRQRLGEYMEEFESIVEDMWPSGKVQLSLSP